VINPLDMGKRVVIITGASSGIGRQTAILLSELGAVVVLAGRDREKLKETRDLMSGEGHVVEAFDLNDVDGIDLWFRGIVNRVGPLYAMVHCAGIQKTRPLKTLNSKTVDEIMRVNVHAGLGLARNFARENSGTGGGAIVFVSGGVALVGQAAVTAYAASKGAIVAMTKSLAVELAKDRIRVNCVCPGYTETRMLKKVRDTLTPDQFSVLERMHPLGIGQPLDVAYAIAFLVADTGRWITGTALVVDGGYTATAH
jgi:NAD(P)-dependent dehydrogenase (short-subunit alcohol dehydrogenase family)